MRKPNILFILLDDLGWRDLSCYGSSFYETPNLDKFALEGMRFSDAYASCPVCSPTRASILTGKYPATLGLTNYIPGHEVGKLISAPYIHYLPREEITIAKALKIAGYRTYHVGKWHLGSKAYWPENHGFDVNIAGCDWGMPQFGYFSPYMNPRLTNGPRGEYLTDRLTNEAINLLKQNGQTPFFMYLAYYAVHIPIQVPEQYIQKYQEKAKRTGLDQKNPFEMGEHFPTLLKMHLRIKRRLFQSDPNYAGMIDNLDENFGRLMKSLEELGLSNNTIVVFTSDNGGLSSAEKSPTSNLPLSEGKGWMYEGGTRVPLLIRWPERIIPNSQCNIPIISTDFYPTFLEAAGLPLMPQQHMDGESLMPLLINEGSLTRNAIFWHYPHYGNQGGTPAIAIRAGEYKLIEFFEDGHKELYNLKEDIEEKHEIGHQNPEKFLELSKLLDNWKEKVNARIPRPNPKYKRTIPTLLLAWYRENLKPHYVTSNKG